MTDAHASATLWGLHEITLDGPSGGNPYLDVALSARFSQGDTSLEVPGFYDGDGVYRIRFMPQAEGRWSWRTSWGWTWCWRS